MTLNANILGITIYTGNHTLYSDGQYVKYTEEMPSAMEEQVLDAAGNTVYFHSGNFKADDAHITPCPFVKLFQPARSVRDIDHGH